MDTFTTSIKVFAAPQIGALAVVAPLHLIRAKIEAAGFGALLA